MRPVPRHARSVLLTIACMVATGGAARAQDRVELSREARRSLNRALLSVNTIFRPSVTISKGSGRGSGTVFASYPGETLILTAAHVVAPEGPLAVEIQPYNLGIEDDPRGAEGTWPRRYPAEVVAREVPGDVAIVRMRPRFVMPYVARIANTKELPEPGEILMSVGVDAGSPLDGWRTDVRGTPTLDIGKGGFRPFITTNKPPVPGRSGGGLFLPDGAIVGVCVGRLSVASEGRTFGVFASITTIGELIHTHKLEPSIAHSVTWHHRGTGRTPTPSRSARRGRE